MKSIIIIVVFLAVGLFSFSQTENLKLRNALVIGQLEKADERYSVEILLTEILVAAGIKAVPSLNVLKYGNNIQLVATDSIQKIVASKGIDTYLTVSIRGYDKRYKKAETRDNLATSLSTGHLFSLYREEAVSVSFEFTFYREGQFMGTDIIKCGNISSRETVLKRFKKKVTKRAKKWL
jgi:hypothetical protein